MQFLQTATLTYKTPSERYWILLVNNSAVGSSNLDKVVNHSPNNKKRSWKHFARCSVGTYIQLSRAHCEAICDSQEELAVLRQKTMVLTQVWCGTLTSSQRSSIISMFMVICWTCSRNSRNLAKNLIRNCLTGSCLGLNDPISSNKNSSSVNKSKDELFTARENWANTIITSYSFISADVHF